MSITSGTGGDLDSQYLCYTCAHVFARRQPAARIPQKYIYANAKTPANKFAHSYKTKYCVHDLSMLVTKLLFFIALLNLFCVSIGLSRII